MIRLLTSKIFKLALNLLMFKKSRRRLVVLTYHRVKQENDPLQTDDISVDHFEIHIRVLSSFFCILRLDEAVEKLTQGSLPAGAICITFDDGYANNHDIAFPVLRKYNVPAVFFIANGFLNGGCMWNDVVIEAIRRTSKAELDLTSIDLDVYRIDSVKKKAAAIELLLNQLKYRPTEKRWQDVNKLANLAEVDIPTDLMMTNDQIRNLHNSGMEIGGHTINHPILTQIDTKQANNEIATNKKQLENLIGNSIVSFAYPNGRPMRDYNEEHIKILKNCGYVAAVTTSWGAATSNIDLFQIPRITSWDKSSLKLILRIVKTYMEKSG